MTRERNKHITRVKLGYQPYILQMCVHIYLNARVRTCGACYLNVALDLTARPETVKMVRRGAR